MSFTLHHLRLRSVLALIGISFFCACRSTQPDPGLPEPAAVQPATAQPADSKPEAPPVAAAQGPLDVGVQDAILLSLENNQGLVLERLNPEIIRTFESEEEAAFDPVLAGQVSAGRTKAERLGQSGRLEGSTADDVGAEVSLQKTTPAGTTIGAEGSSTYSGSSLYGDQLVSSRLGLTLSQALLRGAGSDANLAAVRQARIDTRISEYELRGFIEILVAQVEITYWDYTLAQRQIEIYDESLKVAEQQLAQTRERIAIGQLAETEQAAADAEVALRKEDLINAHADLATVHLRLLRLLNPPGSGWDREITVRDHPAVPDAQLEPVDSHATVALQMRPDLNQAYLGVQRGDLELVKTKNGLLPKLDAFITLGGTGYADSFGGSITARDGDGYDALAGLRLEYPLGNRSARSKYTRAVYSRRQASEAVKNLEQLIQVDVRSAYIEVNRTREQVTATAATRALQEEKLRAETEKFKVGKSTSLLVANAQRDLVAAKIAEVQAVVNYLKAFVRLYQMEGSLLTRRGIAAPGQQPVERE